PFLKKRHRKALILGTGGASKAVAFVFGELGIKYKFVSRNPNEGQLGYIDLNEKILKKNMVLVNCTPRGTFPNIADKPDIPYHFLSTKHLLFDLIYNPEKTAFLAEGEKQGATICNGLRMLELQAEKSWKIWNS
ncbi:MAG: shikimate dehydrogenase, partial [Maribacter sp.]|nr:shikimate dehydrogenase [Maribacter sp.]